MDTYRDGGLSRTKHVDLVFKAKPCLGHISYTVGPPNSIPSTYLIINFCTYTRSNTKLVYGPMLYNIIPGNTKLYIHGCILFVLKVGHCDLTFGRL